MSKAKKDEVLKLRITNELKKAFEKHSEKQNKSVSDTLREMIKDKLNEQDKER